MTPWRPSPRSLIWPPTLDVTVHDSARTPASTWLSSQRLAVGVVHRNQRAAVRVELDRQAEAAGLDASEIVVDTANRLQGREFDVVVGAAPPVGPGGVGVPPRDGSPRVLLSRHRQACIVVGRAGIADVLDAHPGDTPIWLGAPIPIPDGWEANQIVIEHLVTLRRG